MSKYFSGFAAGFAATLVVSVLMVMKAAIGLMPELDVISMLSAMMGTPVAIGWVAHFAIGTIVWGGLFAVVYGAMPGPAAVLKGILFGIAAWLLMMIAIMPMTGAGIFGLALGIMAPVMTLMLHIVSVQFSVRFMES